MNSIECSRVKEILIEMNQGKYDSFAELCNICRPLMLNILNRCGYDERVLNNMYYDLFNVCTNSKVDNIYVWLHYFTKRELIKYIRENEKLNIEKSTDFTILRIKKFIKRYIDLYKEKPSISDIAFSLNLDENYLKKLFSIREISLQSPSGDEKKELYNSALVHSRIDEKVCDDNFFQKLFDDVRVKGILDDEEFKILSLLSEGKTYQEISKVFNCSQQNIGLKVKKIRNKIKYSKIGFEYYNPEYVRKK